ncbi:DUF885 family protein [Sinomonas atrocyanea]
MRDEYARREGAAFDIKAFHKKALDIGGVGLDTLKAALLDRAAHPVGVPDVLVISR